MARTSPDPVPAGGVARPSFWPIAAVAGYDAIGYALVGPVLPALKDKAGASSLVASLIFSGFSVGMFAGFALAIVAVRRRGPRIAGAAGVVLHLAADAMFMAGHTAGVYTTARVLQGMGSGAVWIASVFAVLTLWPDRPEARLGRILSAYSVGAVAGPLLAGLGGTIRPFAADLILGLAVVPASLMLPSRHGRPFGWRSGTLREPRLAFASLVVLYVAMFYAAIEGSYTLHFSSRLTQTGLAVLVAVVGLTFGLGAGVPVAARGPREGKSVAQIGLVISGLLLLEVTLFDNVPAWFALLGVMGFALGATEAGVLSVVSSISEGGILTAMLVYSQAFALGYLIGPPATTWLSTSLGLVASAAILFAGALACSAAGFLVPLVPRGRAPRV